MNAFRPFTRTRLLALASLLAPLASCVTQQEYDEMQEMAELYQRQSLDYEDFVPELQAENQLLREELELLRNAGDPIPASYTQEIDERMGELQAMLAGSDTAPGNIAVFEVDGGIGYRLGQSVIFELSSTEIREEGRAVLQRLAEEIGASEYRRVWVRGHTDDVPMVRPDTLARFPHGNLQLSVARAIEVAAFLKSAGVSPDRVAVSGFGPNEPIVPNDSSEGRDRNRRVEIYVLDANGEQP